MKNITTSIILTTVVLLTLMAYKTKNRIEISANETYHGTASVSQGFAKVSIENIYACSGGRKAPIGTSTAADGSTWTVPAAVNFTNKNFPFASDLYNPCSGLQYKSATDAIAALDGTDIVSVDSNGEITTAFVFTDNYFEMYINGVPVGKDNVPYTQFNSNIVRFKVNRPFTIAMKLVDWEENSGLGSENNRGTSFFAGDGGMVAVFKNQKGEIIATTNKHWKAQTFYTAPITHLSCPTEKGTLRLSNNCSTEGSNDGAAYYALHWKVPSFWYNSTFDDSLWPNATTYTNAAIGVDNKPAYTNFTDVFDDRINDAEFIWSTNVVLDNEVIVRFTVK